MTATLKATPAVTNGYGATLNCAVAAAATVMPLWTPRIRPLLDWATVSDWVPAVFRMAVNVWMPGRRR